MSLASTLDGRPVGDEALPQQLDPVDAGRGLLEVVLHFEALLCDLAIERPLEQDELLLDQLGGRREQRRIDELVCDGEVLEPSPETLEVVVVRNQKLVRIDLVRGVEGVELVRRHQGEVLPRRLEPVGETVVSPYRMLIVMMS